MSKALNMDSTRLATEEARDGICWEPRLDRVLEARDCWRPLEVDAAVEDAAADTAAADEAATDEAAVDEATAEEAAAATLELAEADGVALLRLRFDLLLDCLDAEADLVLARVEVDVFAVALLDDVANGETETVEWMLADRLAEPEPLENRQIKEIIFECSLWPNQF